MVGGNRIGGCVDFDTLIRIVGLQYYNSIQILYIHNNILHRTLNIILSIIILKHIIKYIINKGGGKRSPRCPSVFLKKKN